MYVCVHMRLVTQLCPTTLGIIINKNFMYSFFVCKYKFFFPLG